MSPEIKETITDSGQYTSDEPVLEDIGMDSIDSATLRSYRESLRACKGGHPWVKLQDEDFLEVIGAAGQGRDGILHPTRAGLLMFGKEHRITHVYPEYFLDYREGNGAERWSYRLQSQSGEWSGNVFDFFTAVTGRLSVSVVSPFKLDGWVRRGDSDAFAVAREAVANALIHSDYNVGAGVVIELRHNVITVSNPGTFRIPLSDAVKGGKSHPGNSRIMMMFLLVGLAERAGSGLYSIVESERAGVIDDVKVEESRDM
ncbi:MAG: hypothetical protein LBS92_05755 [Candidatus Methanoplasma sp.]|jgi:predicted HTH transcriptional regulator|nr:hypothetical protein [Candidatus Methanoplasma sp.]